MNKKKRNTIITIVVVALILFSGGIYYILNHSVVEHGFSVLEKKWISDHTHQVVNVGVFNDVPVYGYNGSGINFDFLDYFTSKQNVSFNKVSYYAALKKEETDFGFLVLEPFDKVSDHDILFGEDYYAVMALDMNHQILLNEVDKIGVLESDVSLLKKYFGDGVEVVTYKDVTSLMESVTKKEISFVCLPILQYMDKTLENKLNIVLHLDDLKKSYVLRVKDDLIYSIMNKAYFEYSKQDYIKDYSKNYLNVYFNATNTDDVSRKNYNSKIYQYGYVVNMPFENIYHDEFVGTVSNYLNNFEDISSSEIGVKKYQSIDDLKSALVSGDVDFALTNFDYENLNLKYVTTSSFRDLSYVVLSREKIIANSLKGLVGKKVSVVNGSLLHMLCKNNGVEVRLYSDTDELLRSVDDQSVVLLDKETYQYYRNSKLKDYYVVLRDSYRDGYRFIMNDSNVVFNNMFRYYVESVSYANFQYDYHIDSGFESNYTSLKIVIFIGGLVLFLVASIWFLNRKNVTNNALKKDEKLKYIDELTSLKNRTYLNKNIYVWDDNVIFPQSIVVFDLDHIKRVNDKYGREAGDEIIKQVAGILINQQLENTDIIRSDGDEFIVYMVGYDEKQVSEYMKKMLKLMKDIPKSLGVEAGYSMIYDEVKTVDDAINEAILMMMKKKDIS